MNGEVAIDHSSTEQTSRDRTDRLASLDREQLQQHIQSLEQKLARQKSKNSVSILSEEQQQQLVTLLDKRIEKEQQGKELQALIDRTTELNQQSEQVQQDIQGLNIVSENATNKCYEITYNAQFVIDQNQTIQKSLNEHLERSITANEQCEELRTQLIQSVEHTALTQQKMDSATDRGISVNEKSSRLLEELNRCKLDVNEQLNVVEQVIEVSKRTNEFSESLQQQLQQLGERVRESLTENQQQREAGEIVMDACTKLSEEIAQERQRTEKVLERVLTSNGESIALNSRMADLIDSAEVCQKENKTFNLELQSSLLRNQQHREELTVLTSECREVRDESELAQQNHTATIREALEKLTVALAETRQEKAQVECALKEVFTGNSTARELAEQMTSLISTSEVIQEDNTGLNNMLNAVLEKAQLNQQELEQLAIECSEARDKTNQVLHTSVQINEDSQSSIGRLNEYMDTMCETRDELNELIGTSRKTNEDAHESLDAMRTNINNSTLIQKECMRLNKESVTATLEAKRTSEKYAEELESSFKLNKHYQDRLKAAEKKYQAAIEAERKYLELHETSMKALHDNEALLEKARLTMQEYSDNSEDYSNSIKEFQQTTVQSQKIILESQSSLKTLLKNNEQLSNENRFLKSQVQNNEPRLPDNVWPDFPDSLQDSADSVNSLEKQLNRANALNSERHVNR
ncbi:MAG: hypothetical protein GKR91_05760 [Pseudomonadales bacterium]|nr:hypothetical protein [Pseudomonadales bacterium]